MRKLIKCELWRNACLDDGYRGELGAVWARFSNKPIENLEDVAQEGFLYGIEVISQESGSSVKWISRSGQWNFCHVLVKTFER